MDDGPRLFQGSVQRHFHGPAMFHAAQLNLYPINDECHFSGINTGFLRLAARANKSRVQAVPYGNLEPIWIIFGHKSGLGRDVKKRCEKKKRSFILCPTDEGPGLT